MTYNHCIIVNKKYVVKHILVSCTYTRKLLSLPRF